MAIFQVLSFEHNSYAWRDGMTNERRHSKPRLPPAHSRLCPARARARGPARPGHIHYSSIHVHSPIKSSQPIHPSIQSYASPTIYSSCSFRILILILSTYPPSTPFASLISKFACFVFCSYFQRRYLNLLVPRNRTQRFPII